MDERAAEAAYEEIVRGYIQDEDETLLYQAAQLGRELLEAQVPLETVVEMHAGVLEALNRDLPPAELTEVTSQSFAPFMETMMAYGVAFQEQLEAIQRHINELEEREREIRRRNEELAVLNAIAFTVNATLGLDERLEAVAQEVTSLFEADAFFIALYDDETHDLDFRVRIDQGVREPPERFPLGAGLASLVVTEKKPLLVHDFEKERGNLPRAQLWGTMAYPASWLGVPMLMGERMIGVICVQAYRPHAYNGAELLLLSTIADQVAVAVENARLHQAVQDELAERVRAEEERERLLARVREQARRFQQILETVPDGVLLLDGNLLLVLANRAAREYLAVLAQVNEGESLTHLGGRPLAELLTSPPRGLWHEVEVDGPPRQAFELISRPMESGSVATGWVLVIRDVTERQEIQQRVQQQERLAAVGQLAAGIAHDFNNIMAVITLYAQTSLRTPDLPPGLGERLEIMNEQAGRASHLINQILGFSRRSKMERRPMDLLPLLKDQVKLLRRTVPENIQIELFHDRDECPTNADPTSMQQVMMNLAVNARDAMPAGGRFKVNLERIQITDRKMAPLPEMEEGEWVGITVADTGTGIPAEVLPHVFEPFFTTKAAGKGTGLGLAQVWGIVKQHEGHISVDSRVGHGTSFTIYLPALAQYQPQLPSVATQDLPRGQGETILVVEDDPLVLEALIKSLELLNYRVLGARNGSEALVLYEQRRKEIALVLSDLVMPEMGGMALAHALQERGLTAPLVVLSGHPVDETKERLQSAGVVAWMQKPPSLTQLAKVVAQGVAARHSEIDKTPS